MFKTQWPNLLEAHATIGMFTPSEPLWDSRMSSVNRGVEILRNHGFEVMYAPNVGAQKWDAAGSQFQRIDDLATLVYDERVQSIAATWGGKAANQLVGLLDYVAIWRERKPMWGFSDVGVLLNDITYRTGLITYFGPNVVGKLHETEHADLSLMSDSERGRGKNVFASQKNYDKWRMLTPSKNIQGQIIGGNLSTFTLGFDMRLLKNWEGDFILFWESVSDTPQIIKQHLNCLRISGLFDRVTAMIVGDVRWDKDEYEHEPLDDMLCEFAANVSISIVRCPTFGHGVLENPIIPIGANFNVAPDAINSFII